MVVASPCCAVPLKPICLWLKLFSTAVEAVLGDGCNTSIRGLHLAMAAASHGGRRGSAWSPAMEVVVAQSQPGGRGEGGRREGGGRRHGRREEDRATDGRAWGSRVFFLEPGGRMTGVDRGISGLS